MKLTQERLDEYNGGQMEVQDPDEGYMYRGEIERIVIEEGELRVRFKWLAEAEGFPPVPLGWTKANDDKLDYTATLEYCSASDDVGLNRLHINYAIGETLILFPPDGSKLDPSDVKGLEIEIAKPKNSCHPELREGEVFFMNVGIDENLGGDYPDEVYTNLRFRTKRLGRQAYDMSGNEVTGFPVFVQFDENPTLFSRTQKETIQAEEDASNNCEFGGS